jgi:hypothetical protein
MNANDLLAINDRDVECVEFSGIKAYVRSLTAGEQIDLDIAMKSSAEDIRKLLAVQLRSYVCNENGESLLNDEQAMLFVEKRKPSTVTAIIESAAKLNGFGQQEALKGN